MTDIQTDADGPQPDILAAGLYIVATPIGNLGDITLRAIKVLSACELVACEDTRVTGKLLNHLGITKKMWRYDDHSDEAVRVGLIERMRGGPVALVSDAGMPLVSDPGYRLVEDARAAGVPVTVVPGASAPLTALALSGMPNDRFLFAGFLPAKDKARGEVLAELAPVQTTLIFFETAPRLGKSLAAIAEILPGREVAVARELTKFYEECVRGSAAEVIAHFDAHPPRGEIVLLIGPPVAAETSEADADAMLQHLLATENPSRAAAEVAKVTGMDRKALYARAMELKGA